MFKLKAILAGFNGIFINFMPSCSRLLHIHICLRDTSQKIKISTLSGDTQMIGANKMISSKTVIELYFTIVETQKEQHDY